MPDFFSRLVKRTFGLITVAQPAMSSIFDPGLSVKSDYIQSLASYDKPASNLQGLVSYDEPASNLQDLDSHNEPASNQDGISIDSSRNTGTIPQYDNWPALSREKSFNKYDMKSPDQVKNQDIQRGFISVSEPLHNIESLKQNDLNFPGSIEPISLQAISVQDNRDFYMPSAKLAQDNTFFYKIGSDTLESIESEILHSEDRNNRNTLPSVPKLMSLEEQSDKNEQDFQEHVEPNQKDFTEIKEDTNIPAPMIRQRYDREHYQSSGTISLRQMEPKLSSLDLRENQNISRSATPEPELPYEGFSAAETSSKNSGENSSARKEYFVDSVDSMDSHVEPDRKDFRDPRENTTTLMPVEKQRDYKEQSQINGQPQIPEIVSLKKTAPKLPYSVALQENQNIIQNITADTELPSEYFYTSKPSSKSSGENSSGQKEPFVNVEQFVNGLDNRTGESLLHKVSGFSHKPMSSSNLIGNETTLQNKEPVSRTDFNPSHLNSDSRLSPVTSGGRNLEQRSNPKVNAFPGSIGNMLIEHHAAARRLPPAIPTIKVTIGRIEVRAVEPPRVPQAPPPTQYPVLSLDDYLKQSNG